MRGGDDVDSCRIDPLSGTCAIRYTLTRNRGAVFLTMLPSLTGRQRGEGLHKFSFNRRCVHDCH